MEYSQPIAGMNDSWSMATHKGTLTLSGQGIELELKEVLYCPEIEYNLISTWDLASNGYEVTHNTDELWIKSKVDGKRYNIATSTGDHLFRGYSNLQPEEANLADDFGKLLISDSGQWINAQQFALVANIKLLEIPNPFGPRDVIFYHLACCHAPLEALKALKKLNVISFTEKPGDIEWLKSCRICNESNLIAKSHKKGGAHKTATRKHERIHSDTMGPILGDRGRSIYVTTLTDEYSRYMEVIVTDTKSFKEELMRKISVWANRFPDCPIRFFRSDNATEMPTKEELEIFGIEKEPIASYSPEENGFAEAMNKILIRKIKNIIKPFDKYNYLPLLHYIIEHAAYMSNLIKPRAREQLPYTLYQDKIVNHTFYQMFGVDVTVKVNNAQEAKTLGARYDKFHNTVKGSYIGHHGTAGYKVLVNLSQVIFTKDVVFEEKMDNLIQYFEKTEDMDLETIHPDKTITEQLEQSREVNKIILQNPEMMRFSNEMEILEFQNTEKEVVDALETAPLMEAVEDSYRCGHAVVPGESNLVTTIEEPDGEARKYTSYIMHQKESEDQRDQNTGPWRTVESELEQSVSDAQTGIAEISLMGLETPRASTNSNTRYGSLILNPAFQQNENETSRNEVEKLSPVQMEEDTNQITPILNFLSSEDQDGVQAEMQGGITEHHEVTAAGCHSQSTKGDPTRPGLHVGITSGAPCDDNILETTLEGSEQKPSAPEQNQTYEQAIDSEQTINREQTVTGEPVRITNLTGNRPIYSTRSGRQVRMPMRFIDRSLHDVQMFAVLLVNNLRLKHKNEPEWKKAEEKEMNKFVFLDVWDWSKIPKNATLIPMVWVYGYKEEDIKGAVYKARCVVQGFRQQEGVHFNKYRVLSPVAELLSIRLLTIIATEYNYTIHHLDIESAYLNAPLPDDEHIYVKPPTGYDNRPGLCWKLKKLVYGMKQSGYQWYQFLSKKLEDLGLTQNDYEETIFTRKSKFGKLIVALYVDDLFLVADNESVLDEFKNDLLSIFDLKYFGAVSEYLGVKFKRTKTGYVMSQKNFLQNLVDEFKPYGVKFRRSPVKVDYDGYGSNNNPKRDEFYETPKDNSRLLKQKMKTLYESGVGSINWAASNTRPDLSFAANYLATRCANPTENDMEKLMHCIGYIEQSLDQVLEYSQGHMLDSKGGLTVETFSDASFAPESDVRLVSGMVIYVNRNPVKWHSKKQKNITRSTAAAELVALSIAEDRTVHLTELIQSLGYTLNKVMLYEDNQAVIACCQTKSISHSRKMVDIGMKIIRERLSRGYYSIEYVNTLMNVADMFTKALPAGVFSSMVARLLVQDETIVGTIGYPNPENYQS